MMTNTKPRKSRNINIRITDDLYAVIQNRAVADDRSLSSMTRRMLTAACAEDLAVVDPRTTRPVGGPTPFDGGRP